MVFGDSYACCQEIRLQTANLAPVFCYIWVQSSSSQIHCPRIARKPVAQRLVERESVEREIQVFKETPTLFSSENVNQGYRSDIQLHHAGSMKMMMKL